MAVPDLLKIGGVAVLVGAVGYFVLPQLNKGDVFIPGGQPVSSDQVRAKLQSDGWSNVNIRRQGRYIEAIGLKDGHEEKIWVNAEDGHLRVLDDDDYGEEQDND